MNILADLHHADLYYSLYLLFEKRLGHKLYSPIGIEWHQAGYWQHLIEGPYGSTTPCLSYVDRLPKQVSPDVHWCLLRSQKEVRRGITLDKFKDMRFDIVISTLPKHWVSFQKLISDLQPQAKHIAQIGNLGPDWSACPVKNILSSAPLNFLNSPEGKHVLYYNQEFSLDTFRYSPPATGPKKITSFIHCMPKEQFLSYSHVLPEFEFRAYGVGFPSQINTLNDIAECMQKSTFGWHVKSGDGYGHILHNWLAMGRPVITRLSDYKHRTDRLVHGQSCIDLDANSFARNVELIREWSAPDAHAKMCASTYNLFRQCVDFNRDAENVKKFLEGLL
jgi:hypothetical protein